MGYRLHICSSSQAACRDAVAYCKNEGKNISKLALQYSLSNKEISSVLVGMNSIRQVQTLYLQINILSVIYLCFSTAMKGKKRMPGFKSKLWDAQTNEFCHSTNVSSLSE